MCVPGGNTQALRLLRSELGAFAVRSPWKTCACIIDVMAARFVALPRLGGSRSTRYTYTASGCAGSRWLTPQYRDSRGAFPIKLTVAQVEFSLALLGITAHPCSLLCRSEAKACLVYVIQPGLRKSPAPFQRRYPMHLPIWHRSLATASGGMAIQQSSAPNSSGLETFIEIHRCNELRKKLQFDEKFPLELMADIPGPEPTEGSQSGDEMLNPDDADDADDDAAEENSD
ncbi:hypothetical protein B0H14DRAFT_3137556 [Mycena olivaceomarginata]|nr:hypothetical protein B0H14DRAFT_3137556 [Mycena olivaceomarginata]